MAITVQAHGLGGSGTALSTREGPLCTLGQPRLPLRPAGRGGMSSRGFAEFWGSGSPAPTDAPEARPAGPEGAEGTAKSQ